MSRIGSIPIIRADIGHSEGLCVEYTEEEPIVTAGNIEDARPSFLKGIERATEVLNSQFLVIGVIILIHSTLHSIINFVCCEQKVNESQ